MNMINLLKQFQKLQGEAKKFEEKITQEEVVGSSGGGMVEITINGKLEVLNVRVEKKLLEEGDVEMLEELVLAAVNDGIRKVQGVVKEKMREFTGGLNFPNLGIPGIPGMPG